MRDTRVTTPGLVLPLVWALAFAPAAGAQIQTEEPTVVDEPSVFDTLMDRSDLGNVAQAARSHFHAGEREMKRAAKLEAKAAEEGDEAKRGKLESKAAAAYESAAREYLEAVQLAPDLLPAYVGLGAAYRAQGRPDEALKVHSAALAKHPEDDDNFRGWAESLLALDLLGDATRAYSQMSSSQPERAAVLMSVMKGWLEAKRADPGGLDPADVEKLAAWIAQQEG